MQIIFFIIAAIVGTHAQSSEELTDILFQRSATFEERQSVSKVLARNGLMQPLDVTDAIAEACYGVDLCAGLTQDSEFPNYCEATTMEPDSKLEMDDQCYPKYFREQFSCKADITKQSISTTAIAGKLLRDLSSLYNSYTQEQLIDAYSSQYGVDFRELIRNPEALEEFFKANPRAKIHIETVSRESLSLAAYTLDCYDTLNTYLYSKDSSQIKRYYNLYKAVINSMSLYPEFKGKVNRGVRLPQSVLNEHHKVGNTVCYDGFTSTAIHDPKTDMGAKPRNGFLSGKCTQRLYISNSESAIGGKSIDKGSAHKSENEILFEPGSCFRIDKVYPRTDPDLEDDVGTVCEEGQHFNFEMTLVK